MSLSPFLEDPDSTSSSEAGSNHPPGFRRSTGAMLRFLFRVLCASQVRRPCNLWEPPPSQFLSPFLHLFFSPRSTFTRFGRPQLFAVGVFISPRHPFFAFFALGAMQLLDVFVSHVSSTTLYHPLFPMRYSFLASFPSGPPVLGPLPPQKGRPVSFSPPSYPLPLFAARPFSVCISFSSPFFCAKIHLSCSEAVPSCFRAALSFFVLFFVCVFWFEPGPPPPPPFFGPPCFLGGRRFFFVCSPSDRPFGYFHWNWARIFFFFVQCMSPSQVRARPSERRFQPFPWASDSSFNHPPVLVVLVFSFDCCGGRGSTARLSC